MDWLNINVAHLDSPEFISATDPQRSAWMCLMRYCAGQENGGVIAGSRDWNERMWLHGARVLRRIVLADSPLWVWEGGDLHVAFYPAEQEQIAASRRRGGELTALKRWGNRRSANSSVTSSANSSAISSPTSPASSQTDESLCVKERKGKEGKEKEYTPLPPEGDGQAGGKATPAKRTRKPRPGYVLPAELPEPLASRLLALGALKGRQHSTPWAPGEVEAVRAARLDALSDEDFVAQLAPMRSYYLAAIPSEKDYRRRDLGTLLNNWAGELDRARAWAREADDGVQRHG